MVKEPLISIVVPVYNVANYLMACVESIQRQTLDAIEIILVNDGSTDGSGDICDKLAESDERIRVFHKANGGLSDARNYGVGHAQAQYIGFVDSDDTIEPEMYDALYQLITQENVDIALTGMTDYYINESRPAYKQTEGIFTKRSEETIQLVLEGKLASVSAVCKLYKKDILKKHPFPYGKTSEDAHFIIPYLKDSRLAAFNMKPHYNYFHRSGTITTKPYQSSDKSIIEAYTNNLAIVKEYYPNIETAAYFRLFWSYFYVLDKMLKTENFTQISEKKEIITYIRKHYWKILKNPLVGRGRKLAMTGLMFHEKCYKILLDKYTRKYKRIHE